MIRLPKGEKNHHLFSNKNVSFLPAKGILISGSTLPVSHSCINIPPLHRSVDSQVCNQRLLTALPLQFYHPLTQPPYIFTTLCYFIPLISHLNCIMPFSFPGEPQLSQPLSTLHLPPSRRRPFLVLLRQSLHQAAARNTENQSIRSGRVRRTSRAIFPRDS